MLQVQTKKERKRNKGNIFGLLESCESKTNTRNNSEKERNKLKHGYTKYRHDMNMIK